MKSSILLGMAVVSAAACSKHEEPEPKMTPASRITPASHMTPAGDEATQKLTEARCNYEMRCNYIGTNAKYSSLDHCRAVLNTEAQGQMKSCGQGVDQKILEKCLQHTYSQECDGSIEEKAIDACQTDKLCVE